MIVLSILVIALFILFAFLKVTGLIEGGNPSGEEAPNMPSYKHNYDESDQSPSMFEGWFNGDLDKDMYGNPIHPERYRRAKRREAKFFGETYIDD